MKRFFNVAGPCISREHYMLPAQARCADLMPLIEQRQYFVIHAARQSGKTTLLLNLVRQLNEQGRCHALYCSLEAQQEIPDPEKGIPAIVKTLAGAIEFHPKLQAAPFAQNTDLGDFANALKKSLARFCAQLDRPLVIMFDEADCLSNGTLIMFLRQLRNGYVEREQIPFVHSLALVGMRDIRDYKARVRDDRSTLGSASPFNIVKQSLTLRNFTPEEIASLYGQHALETGQAFPPPAVEKAFAYSRGQPWLVNALALEVVERLLKNDATKPITAELVDQAAENIIQRRDTHIDSLLERLKEPRVRRVIEPIILGAEGSLKRLDDDYEYARDLGLIREERGSPAPANPIYAEVMIRQLNYDAQEDLRSDRYPYNLPRYLTPDGRLDMSRLLREFQQFWRENSEAWVERFEYREAAPHLILMAFLQRVLNAGGRITREFAAGRLRLDLCVEYQEHKYPIELKVRYGDQTLAEGQAQLAAYLDRLGCAEGWLVVFDRRPQVSWDAKCYWQTAASAGKTLHLVGC